MAPRVHFWWHFHQPLYTVKQKPILPWVKLHACRDYLDMGKIIEMEPEAAATFNFTPVLLEQLRSWDLDPFFKIFTKPSKELELEEKIFLLEHCFAVNWRTGVYPLQRYMELLKQRGTSPTEKEFALRARQWRESDFEDLQFLFLYTWCGETIRSDPEMAEITGRLKDTTFEARQKLIDIMKRHYTTVIPLFKELRRRGRISLTTTPYNHPILPILLSPSDVAKEHPHLTIPPLTPDIRSARKHLEKARTLHEECFGTSPDGLWPSEGSVSESCVPLFEGFGVVGADEGVLRASEAEMADSARLYTHDKFSGIFAFRDHEISDKIGFVYGGMPEEEAVEDFIRSVSGRHGEGVVHVILDGENPWGGFTDLGREFLRKLYRRCSKTFGLLHSENIRGEAPESKISHLFSGSWIDADFRIWIGDPVKNRAWILLEEARLSLQNGSGSGPSPALMAAQGSDWFWWYGEGNSSPYEPEFDLLFRSHLAEAYRENNLSPPVHLGETLMETSITVDQPPVQTLHPVINGRVDSYYEWEGAGRYVDQGDSMMGSFSPFSQLHYGFDRTHFYLRLDPGPDTKASEAFDNMEIFLSLHLPEKKLIRPGEVTVAADQVLELSVPFSVLGAECGETISFHMIMKRGSEMASRYPRTGLVSFTVPGQHYDEENWCV